MVRVEPDGTVRASLGDPPSGQGYETVVAQIVADELGLTPDAVAVDRGFDSATTPWLYLSGNYSNKFSVTDVGAVVGAARARARQAAAHRRAPAGDRRRRSGAGRRRGAVVRGAPDRRLAIAELARTAYADVLGLPPGEEPGLEARHAHQNPLAEPVDADRRVRSQLVFANAAHCCLVEVDRRTGFVQDPRSTWSCTTAGASCNPQIVEGMVHGSTVHGIGAALLEEFRYDDAGPAPDLDIHGLPQAHGGGRAHIEVDRLEHPSPFTPLGAKGVGEGGAIPGPAAVANAVEDALAPVRRGDPLAADHARARLALAQVSGPAPPRPRYRCAGAC